MTTCMLLHKSLDQVFWVEATNCANYVQNRSPHKALDAVTPFEAWIGRKPSISTLESLVVQHGQEYLHINARHWKLKENLASLLDMWTRIKPTS